MANSLTTNPLIIDTPSATALLQNAFQVKAIIWHAPAAAAGNEVSLQDRNGNVVWPSVASGSNYKEESKWFDHPLWFDGLKVPTLASGTIYLYCAGRMPNG